MQKSSWIFIPYAGESASPFYINKIIRQNDSGLYKTEWKARVEAQTKGERKSGKGGRSLVLVLTETFFYNFHFWVVSLFSYFIWIERKTKLPFLYLLFFLQRISAMTNAPPSWIGVTKLLEKRGQGAPWIEIDELRFAREIFLERFSIGEIIIL